MDDKLQDIIIVRGEPGTFKGPWNVVPAGLDWSGTGFAPQFADPIESSTVQPEQARLASDEH